MKIATNHSGEKIKACADSPQTAICPHCKGTVFLRFRRRSTKPGDMTYFWRHADHENKKCPARFTYTMTFESDLGKK